MKRIDELGNPFCQDALEGVACDGREGHYDGENGPHFAEVSRLVSCFSTFMTAWTDDGGVWEWYPNFPYLGIKINGTRYQFRFPIGLLY